MSESNLSPSEDVTVHLQPVEEPSYKSTGIVQKSGKETEHTAESISEKEQDNEFINTNLNLPFAYSLGLFSGFSPCLMAILGFLLSFTAGTSSSTKNGMIRATVFGLGLVSSYIVLGICLLSFRKSIPSLDGFSFITGIIVILIGLNLLGILKSPVVLDNYFQNSARKYAGTLGGVFFLGYCFRL